MISNFGHSRDHPTPPTLGGQAFLADPHPSLLVHVIVESPPRNLVDLLDFPALNNKIVVFQLFR